MKNLLLTALLGFLFAPIVWAQSTTPTDGYRITGRINGLRDTTVVLAHYFGATQYVPKDTARLDGQGNLVFEGQKRLPEGLYIAVMPKKGYVELLLNNDQEFTFATDTVNIIRNMQVTGSSENELFYGYQQQLGTFYDQAKAIDLEKKNQPAATTNTATADKMASLQKQARDYRIKFLTDNAGTFAVKLLKASAEPEVPTAPKLANGRPDSVWVFNYFKAHFWDDFDFSDERFVRTPVLQHKIDRYVKELTVQVPDSLIRSADFMVSKAQAGKSKEILSYIIWYTTSQYERPKVMGTDGLFVHMFEKYYATGIMPVSDSSTVKNIGERVRIMKPTLVGKVLPSPNVSDTLRRPVVLQNIRADYTVVYFYDPHCGHCRDSAPKLKQFVDAYKGKGVEVVAIAIEQTPEEWKKFIREFKLGKAINAYDYNHRTDYTRQYDVSTTPTLYVLDKGKKIIARKLSVEQLEDFIGFHKRQQATQKPAVAPANAKASLKK